MTVLLRLVWCFLAVSYCWGVEPPTNREAVQRVVERSKQNPEILRELSGAPLDLIMTPLWELYSIGYFTTKQREGAKQAGEEREWLKTEAIAGRDPDYLAKAYPIAWEIVTSHPDFEWTVGSKLTEMTFVLNEEQPKPSTQRSQRYAEINSDYGRQLSVAIRAPGDMAFRLLGPCLFSPYYPDIDHGDATSSSPATHARGALANLLKKRYGEDLPQDIEAARAWWKANEHRFAGKETAAPKTHDGPKSSFPTDAKGTTAPSRSSDSRSERDATSQQNVRNLTIGVVAALLLVVVLFLLKRR